MIQKRATRTLTNLLLLGITPMSAVLSSCQGVDESIASDSIGSSQASQYPTNTGMGWPSGGYSPLPSTEEGASDDASSSGPSIDPAEAGTRSAPDLFGGGGLSTPSIPVVIGENPAEDGFELVLGSTVYTSVTARSPKYSVSGQSIETELCPAGSAMTGYTLYTASWVLEDSITAIDLKCRDMNSGSTTVKTLGVRDSGASSAYYYSCFLGPWMTGLRTVEDGQYLLDLHPRCGTEEVTESLYSNGTSRFRFEIGANEYYSYYQTNRSSPFTDQTSVECTEDQVMVGLKAKYRRDGNEAAFTELRGICAPVTAEAI
jgi:hypothetical protein